MSEHKCNSCFYMQNERSRNPCNVCEGYNKYVNRNIYIQRPDTIEIKTWDDASLEEDYFDEWDKEQYMKQVDNVKSPKHYMLFEDKGIEVRDVLEKLSQKVYESYYTPTSMPMALSDYVQMMQYLMRFMDKNGKEDLEKARWYLDKLIDAYGTDS